MGLGLCSLKIPVSLSQNRGRVGLLNSRSIVSRSKVNNSITPNNRNNTSNIACSLISVNEMFLFFSLYSVLVFIKENVILLHLFIIFICLFFFSFLVSLSGDVEVNLGPNRTPNEALSICHRNLNSISAHNFARLHLLKAYVTVHKVDIICLSKIYLNSSIPFDDNNLKITGYNLIRSNHPSNSKRGGVCIKKIFLDQCINFQLKIGDKLCRFVALYKSPSQTKDDFCHFHRT